MQTGTFEEINSAYDVQLEENEELKKEIKEFLKRVKAIEEKSNTIGKERDAREKERNELREKVAYLEKEVRKRSEKGVEGRFRKRIVIRPQIHRI